MTLINWDYFLKRLIWVSQIFLASWFTWCTALVVEVQVQNAANASIAEQNPGDHQPKNDVSKIIYPPDKPTLECTIL